ncbi:MULTISPECIES: hypothetical protein [Cobetia]|uniref:hypothetical protein n=1 Tax=Cobetia TaxID=204286 RepID=UPI001C2EDE0B|nr:MULTISPECIES: hypothetical protein [Cobetia]MDI4661990.1 hypothetical protein [Cobetia sp. BMC6]
MRVKTDFPHRVREIEHTLIPLSDGTRLAARIWLPQDADRTRAEIVWHYHAGRGQHGRDSALGETTPGQFDVRVESHYRMRCDAENFYLEAEQIAWQDDEEVHRRGWQRTVPRSSV